MPNQKRVRPSVIVLFRGANAYLDAVHCRGDVGREAGTHCPVHLHSDNLVPQKDSPSLVFRALCIFRLELGFADSPHGSPGVPGSLPSGSTNQPPGTMEQETG